MLGLRPRGPYMLLACELDPARKSGWNKVGHGDTVLIEPQ